MTHDRITRALAKASKDYRHAVAMGELAFSEAAKRRHARRAKVAAARIRDARRELASGSLLIEA